MILLSLPQLSISVLKTHVLAIEGIDWLCHDNGSKHKTSPFELVSQKKACIVRRGDIMNLTLKCRDRAFDLNKDRISLTFEFGINPSVVKGDFKFIFAKKFDFAQKEKKRFEDLEGILVITYMKL